MEKEERNKEFTKNWKSGMTGKELMRKYKLSQGGLRGLKSRLRKRDPGLYVRKSVLRKSINMQKSKRVEEEKRINVTIRLSPGFFAEAKIYAIKHKSIFPTFSSLVEGALREKIGRK